ncbi:GAF domain-containing sensor histidine kinase [Candidatus Sumerlaeota bacterium]|nr:GAF domain-containing sensor histidine kinase [Candidatus Sumerlaeota bacterium]
MNVHETSDVFELPGGKDPREQRTIEALFRVNRFISAVGDLHQLLELIMSESKTVMDCDSSSLMLYDEKSNELYFEVAQGPKSKEVIQIRLHISEGIAGACASERRTLVVPDVQADSRFYRGADEVSRYQTRNILAAPMVRGERLIGVLEVLNKHDDADFTPEDVKIIEFFADQAAIAIENALLIREKVEAERLAAFGVAIASISHYIKNILAGIMGSSSLIDIGIEQSDQHLIEEAWSVLKRSNRKISDLVHDMLSYSKHREPEWKYGSLNKICRDAYENQQARAEELGVALECGLQEDLPDTEYDPKMMLDAVLNLVGNAVEACEGIPGARVRLSSEHLADTDNFRLIVADNGPGIPEEIQRRVFDAFFTTKSSRGTGLGLAVTKKSVEEHGGQLLLDSKPGKGAVFRILLPRRDPSF